jgi:hypothetical protein
MVCSFFDFFFGELNCLFFPGSINTRAKLEKTADIKLQMCVASVSKKRQQKTKFVKQKIV